MPGTDLARGTARAGGSDGGCTGQRRRHLCSVVLYCGGRGVPDEVVLPYSRKPLQETTFAAQVLLAMRFSALEFALYLPTRVLRDAQY